MPLTGGGGPFRTGTLISGNSFSPSLICTIIFEFTASNQPKNLSGLDSNLESWSIHTIMTWYFPIGAPSSTPYVDIVKNPCLSVIPWGLEGISGTLGAAIGPRYTATPAAGLLSYRTLPEILWVGMGIFSLAHPARKSKINAEHKALFILITWRGDIACTHCHKFHK